MTETNKYPHNDKVLVMWDNSRWTDSYVTLYSTVFLCGLPFNFF